jgi:predicted dehydrogenase
VDAVVLATPAKDHAEQARMALNANKHVLVEKPMALDAADAHAVVSAADTHKRVLMVGHLMLYHPAVAKVKAMIDAGELGQIFYIYSTRVNLGRVRLDENALWSLAPHDISMIEYLLGDEPDSVSARGGIYLQSRIEDVVFVNLRFRSGVSAQIQVSWLDPRKQRRLTIVGSQKMVEFDDVHPVDKIRIYDKGVDRPPTFTEYAQFLSIRNGDIHIPQVPMVEPLEQQTSHFIECIAQGTRPRTDGHSGLRVVRVLEAAQKSLESDGAPVSL